MIYTVTLNPAVDKAVQIDGLKIGGVNRSHGSMYDPAGKGINVSRALTVMGVENTAVSFCGGDMGLLLRRLLNSAGVRCLFTPMAADVRITVNISDAHSGECTVITESGGPVSPQEYAELETALLRRLAPGDFVVISGSVPSGLAPDVCSGLAAKAAQAGALIFFDSSGDALADGVKLRPRLIKPNLEELSALAGRELTLREAPAFCRELAQGGVGEVLLSLGGDGAMLVSADRAYRAMGVRVDLRSTLGAGDTMLAAYIWGLALGEGPEAALKRAVSASAAKVEVPGTGMPDAAAMTAYIDRVETHRIF